MALDLSFLTNPAECDEVYDALTVELASYRNRDTNLDYADTRSEQVKAKVKALLIGVEAEIVGFNNLLATPGITESTRKRNITSLRKATDRRDNLQDQGSARSGPAQVLAQVDEEQVAGQIAILTNAITKVLERRAELTAA